MGRGKGIQLQFEEAINARFFPGEPKDKSDPTKIFGYVYRKELIETAYEMCRFIKSEFPGGIKQIRQITLTHVNAYLGSKEGLSDEYIRKKASHIRKLDHVCGAVYEKAWKKADVNWRDGLAVPDGAAPVRGGERMCNDDYSMIMEHIKSSGTKSHAVKAVILSGNMGFRADEVTQLKAKDVQFEGGKYGYGIIQVTRNIGKGGLDRTVDIPTPAMRDYVERLCRGLKPEDRLVPVKKGTASNFLKDMMVACGIKEKYSKSGIHSLRKMYTQNLWDKNRLDGMSFKENVAYCNQQIGHGGNTKDFQRCGVLRDYCDLGGYG